MDARAPRILIVDDDAVTRHILLGYLERAGYPTVAVADGEAALAEVRREPVLLVLLDLLLPPPDGYQVLKALREDPATRDVPVLVLTALEGDAEVARAFETGADDFIRKPVREVELLARIRSQLRLRSYLVELARKERDAQVMVELTRALASSLDFHEILFTVVRRIAEVVRVERCSIVVARAGRETGYVVAASDDAAVQNLPISLEKYPEIQQVVQTRQALTIDDAPTHPILWEVRDQITSTRYPSLTIIPIADKDQAMGVLFLRAEDGRGRLDERELSFCQIVANTTAVALRNARVLEALREESQAVHSARNEAERKVQLLERYADLFRSSADGMVVIDRSGLLLFSNPRAAEITGYTEADMHGRYVHMLAHPEDLDVARTIRRGFAQGEYPRNVDLRIVRKDGVERTLSLVFSPMSHDPRAVLLTFRDVTDDRAIASELARTKEFFSGVIEASPDAIIAAGLNGVVLLFNSAAERIYGYSRDDVVGKRSVSELYAEGAAREVMRRIRSSAEQRVEGMRIEVVARDGERIPILLSAAMVTEDGKAVATVGVFSDLRERMSMEQRLAQVQEKLALTEKQMIAAALAGAAAHELNQPLTAIQISGEMLQRRSEKESHVARAAEVILRESARMAEIVRKIGSVTQYQTRPYFNTTILDIDRSSEPESK